MRRILSVGCSLTADCGLTQSGLRYAIWPQLVAEHYQCALDNVAIGGCSNREIFSRSVDRLCTDHYDCVIICWTALSRYWIYFSQNNVDDFTGILPNKNFGHRFNDSSVGMMARLIYSDFNNLYVLFKHWLQDIICLQHMLDHRQQPYVFVKGFENLVCDIQQVKYDPNDGFGSMNDSVRQILDFDNRPDDYILAKIQDLQRLLNCVKHENWLNIFNSSVHDVAVDRADDGQHPGERSNQLLAGRLISHCNYRKIF